MLLLDDSTYITDPNSYPKAYQFDCCLDGLGESSMRGIDR